MEESLAVLMGTAAWFGFFHTITGPDHYLPFIVIARARRWTLLRTAILTFICGIGHVLSSVVLGAIGIAIGIALNKLEAWESFRGDIAGWLFIVFGLVYAIWGLWRVIKNKNHTHIHIHNGGILHNHDHEHHHDHDHLHDKEEKANITPWILFLIFVFGPCEVLIPFIMYPAAQASSYGVVWVTAIFGITTIATMLTIVILSTYGLRLTRLGKLEKYTHLIAGLTICLSGLAIQILGL